MINNVIFADLCKSSIYTITSKKIYDNPYLTDKFFS